MVQCYLRDEVASVTPFEQQLRGFRRIQLAAGQSREVVFRLGPDELSMYDQHLQRVVEPGWFTVRIGGSSVGGESARFLVADSDQQSRPTAQAVQMRPEDDAEVHA